MLIIFKAVVMDPLLLDCIVRPVPIEPEALFTRNAYVPTEPEAVPSSDRLAGI
jgi:hypothetical protein